MRGDAARDAALADYERQSAVFYHLLTVGIPAPANAQAEEGFPWAEESGKAYRILGRAREAEAFDPTPEGLKNRG